MYKFRLLPLEMFKKNKFLGGLVVRIQHCHRCGMGLIPGPGTSMLSVAKKKKKKLNSAKIWPCPRRCFEPLKLITEIISAYISLLLTADQPKHPVFLKLN